MRIIATVLFILFVAIVALLFLVAMAITALIDMCTNKERRLTLLISYAITRIVYRACPMWRIEVVGKENFPTDGPCVITANHQSFFDIPLMFFTPMVRGFKFVSKIEVRNIPIIGWMLGLRDDIVIRRGTTSAATCVMEEGTAHLQRGSSVVIFPEGTRSKDNKVHLFKDGAFKLARTNGVAVVPCVLHGTRGLLTRKGLTTRTMRLHILPTITAEEVQKFETARELAQHVQTLTAAEYERMNSQK